MSKLINIAGKKFGKLTAISFENGKWNCVCECDNTLKVFGSHLISGNTKSCGCLKSNNLRGRTSKLIEGRRKNDPRIASARRVWKNTYCYRDSECISFEKFMVISQQNCTYCGINPSTRYNHFKTTSSKSSNKSKQEGLFIYNGLDRVDSTKSHTIDNIVPCCRLCNQGKNNRTTTEFIQWVNRIKINNFKQLQIKNLKFPDKPLSSSVKAIFYPYKKDTNISIETFYSISQMNCYYCDNKPNNYFDRGKSDKKASLKTKQMGSFYYNGLDRVDSTKSHTIDNIVPCCYYCNFAKNKLSILEFYSWICRIKNYQTIVI